MYVVKKNIYAERNSQKSTLLHNIVNPSKHQDRPNVGAVPGQRRRHGPTLNMKIVFGRHVIVFFLNDYISIWFETKVTKNLKIRTCKCSIN